jgi:hypothetical protein
MESNILTGKWAPNLNKYPPKRMYVTKKELGEVLGGVSPINSTFCRLFDNLPLLQLQKIVGS